MSLKAGGGATCRRASFLVFGFEGENLVGAVGMWKSPLLRFPRSVGDGGNLDGGTAWTRNVSREFSTVVHRPAFPQRSPVVSCGFLPMQTGEELALGFLHFGGGLGVGFGVGPLRQLIDGEIVC